MTKIKIKLLANQGAPDSIFENAVKRIEKLISSEDYIQTESKPDVLFFITGGSEQFALQQISKGHFYVLIASMHDNSYAAATEVKAYLNNLNIPSILIDEEEAEAKLVLNDFITIKKALENLKGKKLGLIGQISDWLISSAILPEILDTKFGIKLIEIPWKEMAHYSEFNASEQFISFFPKQKDFDLTETSKVSELLANTIKKRNLDAITVECFPLVKKEGITACLPLAKFNNDGFPAGCEGDLTAIVGMMLCKELTGVVPWIANVNKVTDETCMFSHCTIAPSLVSNILIKTHFETGKGTAIQGDFKSDLVTIFRFDKNLSNAFIATANITARPKSPTACRTQIEVKLSKDEVILLKQKPLGNHHLIFPGDCKNLLYLTCKILGINVEK